MPAARRFPPPWTIDELRPRRACNRSADAHAERLAGRENARRRTLTGLSPLRLGQQVSCVCDCRNSNADDEKLERSGERTIFEFVDSRKQTESNEADGEYVEGAARPLELDGTKK